jgi:hypothetical protein
LLWSVFAFFCLIPFVVRTAWGKTVHINKKYGFVNTPPPSLGELYNSQRVESNLLQRFLIFLCGDASGFSLETVTRFRPSTGKKLLGYALETNRSSGTKSKENSQ